MRFAILTQTTILALAAVGLTACSDPVPPTPQGAWSVSFQPQDGNAAACPIVGHVVSVGSVTANTKTHLIPNGVSEAGDLESSDLSCTVSGTNKFDISASMTQVQQDGLVGLDIKVNGLTAAATEMSPAPGSASFSSPKTGNPYSPPEGMSCNFFFIPNSGEGVAGGRIWVAFTCPTVIDGSTMKSTCQLKQSFAIFENCTQGG